jgi:oligopeptide/dipeptide ABC transporter ATP-binding protein
MGALPLAAALGPLIAGALLAFAGWRAIFLVNVPLVVVPLVLGWRSLPRALPMPAAGAFDVLGGVLLSMFLLAAAWALLRAVPRLDDSEKRKLESIAGSPPNMLKPPAGCPFHPRCTRAMNVCTSEAPEMTDLDKNHRAACWLMHPDAPRVDFNQEVTKA